MGGFNNVLQAQDIIGGNNVYECEYTYLVEMMEKTYLFEKESICDHFTWYNKQSDGIIYSRIGRVTSNMNQLTQNDNTILSIKDPCVSVHALLFLQEQVQRTTTKRYFKFQNMVTTSEGFLEVVITNWQQPLIVNAMYILWKKLKRFQKVIQNITKLIVVLRTKLTEQGRISKKLKFLF